MTSRRGASVWERAGALSVSQHPQTASWAFREWRWGWWRSPTGGGGLSVRGLERVASVLVAVSLRIVRKRRQEGSEC